MCDKYSECECECVTICAEIFNCAEADNVNNILMNKKNFFGSIITRDSELLVKLFAYYYDDVITTHVIFIHTYIHFYVQCFIFLVVNLPGTLRAVVRLGRHYFHLLNNPEQ